MSGAYAGSRYGQDRPSRIAVSADLLLESGEVPVEVTYQAVIPFYPPQLTTGAGGATSPLAPGSDDEWKQYPDRLDLFCYQGDDVQIPLSFTDANDMSTAAGWEWHAQVRLYHAYSSTLIHDLVAAAEYTPPGQGETQGTTQVTLFLPSALNSATGEYSWEVYSVGPFSGPTYPSTPPDGIDPADWPPTTQTKTWLYGDFTIVPRTTATEFLPPPATSTGVTWTGQAFSVGPNGRVP